LATAGAVTVTIKRRQQKVSCGVSRKSQAAAASKANINKLLLLCIGLLIVSTEETTVRTCTSYLPKSD
jgi:hypothetical protein